jgi:hypothetical protein
LLISSVLLLGDRMSPKLIVGGLLELLAVTGDERLLESLLLHLVVVIKFLPEALVRISAR